MKEKIESRVELLKGLIASAKQELAATKERAEQIQADIYGMMGGIKELENSLKDN